MRALSPVALVAVIRGTRLVARAVVVLVLAGFWVLPGPAFGECVRLWRDFADAKRKATLVFSGTVVQKKPDPDGLFLVFDVDRVWKGAVGTRVTLPLYMTLESYRFNEGGTYLVFAHQLPTAQQHLYHCRG